MRFTLSQLDEDIRSYLLHARHGGHGRQGILVPLTGAYVSLLLFLAAAALGGVVYLTWPDNAQGGSPAWAGAQGGLVGLAFLFLVAALRLRAARERGGLGSFLFADALYLWEVHDDTVKVTSLEHLRGATGTSHFNNGVYQHTAVRIELPAQTKRLTIRDAVRAEQLIRFLNCLEVLRRPDEGDSGEPSTLADNPEVLGPLACRLLTGDVPQAATFEKGRPIPRMEEVPASGPASGVLVPLLAGVLVAGIAYLGFLSLNRRVWDDHLYRQADWASEQNWTALDHYLQEFPKDGRHSEKAQERRDDYRFTKARRDSQEKKSPGALREYLADLGNVRHRDEARQMINVYYDEAIKRLKELAQAKDKVVDRKLFGGLLGILEAFKTAPRPVVTVGFKGTSHVEPRTALEKGIEALQAAQYETQEKEIKQIRERSGRDTAILPVGQVFAPDQVALREGMILDRLRESVQKVLDADILTFERVGEGEAAMMQVSYTTFASGTLFQYSQTQGGPLGLMALGTRTMLGLLREYRTDWEITIRPPGSKEDFVCKVNSKPLQQLRIQQEPGDPEWAAYAVILYSGFHDLSSHLIRSLALDPPPTPNSFSFKDATGKVDTMPFNPGFPGGNPFNIPKIPDIPPFRLPKPPMP